jgi:hypothetical protein
MIKLLPPQSRPEHIPTRPTLPRHLHLPHIPGISRRLLTKMAQTSSRAFHPLNLDHDYTLMRIHTPNPTKSHPTCRLPHLIPMATPILSPPRPWHRSASLPQHYRKQVKVDQSHPPKAVPAQSTDQVRECGTTSLSHPEARRRRQAAHPETPIPIPPTLHTMSRRAMARMPQMDMRGARRIYTLMARVKPPRRQDIMALPDWAWIAPFPQGAVQVDMGIDPGALIS